MDVRESLMAAAEQVASNAAEPASEPARESEETVGEPVAAEESVAAAEPESTPSDARARDQRGRFAAKALSAPPESTATEPQRTPAAPNATEPPKSGATVATEYRPPRSWRATVREQWSALPAEVKAEVSRREKDIETAMRESAPARKHYEEFQRTVGPFEGIIRAEGGEPMSAVRSLLQTATALRTAPPSHKAQLVARMVQQFNVPIDLLDSALAGETATAAAPPEPHQFRDPRLDELLARAQSARQTKTQQECEAFKSSHEWAEELWPDMEALRDAYSARGRTLTLEDAYTRAVLMSKEHSDVMRQREAAKAAADAQASAQRAKAAAMTPKSNPGGPAVPAAKSIRDQLEAAWNRKSAG